MSHLNSDLDSAGELQSIRNGLEILDDFTNIAVSADGPFMALEEWDPYSVIAACYFMFGSSEDLDKLAQFNPTYRRIADSQRSFQIIGEAPTLEEIIDRVDGIPCEVCLKVGAQISINEEICVDGDVIDRPGGELGILVQTVSADARYSISSDPLLAEDIFIGDGEHNNWTGHSTDLDNHSGLIQVEVSHPDSDLVRITTIQIKN